MIKKILLLLSLCLVVSSCAKPEEKNEFMKLYNVDNINVKSMTYDELLELTESKTGVVFIGSKDQNTKELAQIFCDNLCECDVNKAHFVNSKDITDNQLLEKFKVEKLSYPIIAAYKTGELVGFYDGATEPEDLNDYIYNLILAAYPTVCTDAC